MLPNKWNYAFAKATESISWHTNKEYTFQANSCFPKPRHNFLPYFEVFIISISSEERSTVAIGVGSAKISGKGQLPGWELGSFGYHSDDGYLFLGKGTPKPYGPKCTQGDIMGCGITLNNELYFTLNGKNLGVACTLSGAKVFPILGLNNASISTNFGNAPFKFNPFGTIKNDEPDRTSLLVLNETTVLQILSYLKFSSICNIAKTCKTLFNLSMLNKIWKPLVHAEWNTIRQEVTITNYYAFYKKRATKLQLSPNYVWIENCNWEFKCPVILDKEKMKRTTDIFIDHCTVCNKDVHIVNNEYDFKRAAAAKHCVAIDFEFDETNKRRPPLRMGGVVY